MRVGALVRAHGRRAAPAGGRDALRKTSRPPSTNHQEAAPGGGWADNGGGRRLIDARRIRTKSADGDRQKTTGGASCEMKLIVTKIHCARNEALRRAMQAGGISYLMKIN